jgi:hypothetical protein
MEDLLQYPLAVVSPFEALANSTAMRVAMSAALSPDFLSFFPMAALMDAAAAAAGNLRLLVRKTL